MSNNLVHDLAVKAGVRYIEGMESIGGRAYMANSTELLEFARLVGEIARKNEREKALSFKSKKK